MPRRLRPYPPFSRPILYYTNDSFCLFHNEATTIEFFEYDQLADKIIKYVCKYCLLEWKCQRKGWTYQSCTIHRLPFRSKCNAQNTKYWCPNISDKYDIVHNPAMVARITLYHTVPLRDHVDELCSYCDKPIDCTEWFSYCSLCPSCYMLQSEQDISDIDMHFEYMVKLRMAKLKGQPSLENKSIEQLGI